MKCSRWQKMIETRFSNHIISKAPSCSSGVSVVIPMGAKLVSIYVFSNSYCFKLRFNLGSGPLFFDVVWRREQVLYIALNKNNYS